MFPKTSKNVGKSDNKIDATSITAETFVVKEGSILNSIPQISYQPAVIV